MTDSQSTAEQSKPWYKMKRVWAAALVALLLIVLIIGGQGSKNTANPLEGPPSAETPEVTSAPERPDTSSSTVVGG